MLDHIFSQGPSEYNYHLLMGLFKQISDLQVPYSSYINFFASNMKGNDLTTSFMQEIGLPLWQSYQYVPKNGYYSKVLFPMGDFLQEKTGHFFHRVKSYSQSIDCIMENNKLIVEQTDYFNTVRKFKKVRVIADQKYPNKHFVLDCRNIDLSDKLKMINNQKEVKQTNSFKEEI